MIKISVKISFLLISLFVVGLSLCPDNCQKYAYDGCNECLCDDNGNEYNCAQNKECDSSFTEPYCIKCNNNLIWNDCGSCLITCDMFKQRNDACIDLCDPKCECPKHYPIYDAISQSCISKSECVANNTNINNDENKENSNDDDDAVNNTTNDNTNAELSCNYKYKLCYNDQDCDDIIVNNNNIPSSVFKCKYQACTSSICSLNPECSLNICTNDCITNAGWCHGDYNSSITYISTKDDYYHAFENDTNINHNSEVNDNSDANNNATNINNSNNNDDDNNIQLFSKANCNYCRSIIIIIFVSIIIMFM